MSPAMAGGLWVAKKTSTGATTAVQIPPSNLRMDIRRPRGAPVIPGAGGRTYHGRRLGAPTGQSIERSLLKRTIILTALLGGLALPGAAHAEWFYTKQGAE